MTPPLDYYGQVGLRVCAQKKGEVVGPAGGETGVPRCLAEVRKLPVAASIRYFKTRTAKINAFKKIVKRKIKKLLEDSPTNLLSIFKINIQVMTIKCKSKIHFFSFFSAYYVI